VTPPPAQFRFGAGRPCLDFIRTLRHRGRTSQSEELPDGPALLAWTVQAGPLSPGTPPSQAEVTKARQLREAIAQLLDAARSPAGVAACPPAARRLLNQTAAAPPPAPSLDPRGQLRHIAGNPAQAMLSWLARDALDLVTSPALTRLKNCANPDCRIIFLDTSRPGARRWCSMDTCGNQAKKTRLRSKTATACPARGQSGDPPRSR
jgi:predicted RNA-binding Zn ribbon-like protein